MTIKRLVPRRLLRRGPRWRACDELLQWERLPREQFLARRDARLAALLIHLRDRTPLGRAHLATVSDAEIGNHPTDVLASLPVTGKADLRERREMLEPLTGLPPGAYRNATGGSTGEPTMFYQTPEYQAWGLGDIERSFLWCGAVYGDRRAFLWGSDRDFGPHRSSAARLRDRLLGNMWVNVFALDDASVAEAVRELRAFRPALVVAYASAADHFAAAFLAQGGALSGCRAVQTSAEVLTPDMRARIETAFGAPAFNRYGSREVSGIAHECDAHDGLHVIEENNFLELLPLPGHLGGSDPRRRIVVTNLVNRATAFVRYDIGDLVEGPIREEACPCGRPHRRIGDVIGRESDLLRLANGRLLHGEVFTHLFYDCPDVAAFEVVQTAPSEIVVRYVPRGAGPPVEAVARLRSDVTCRIGDDVQLRIQSVTTLPPSSSGKRRFVRRDLA